VAGCRTSALLTKQPGTRCSEGVFYRESRQVCKAVSSPCSIPFVSPVPPGTHQRPRRERFFRLIPCRPQVRMLAGRAIPNDLHSPCKTIYLQRSISSRPTHGRCRCQLKSVHRLIFDFDCNAKMELTRTYQLLGELEKWSLFSSNPCTCAVGRCVPVP
jgi:hypothetical protein